MRSRVRKEEYASGAKALINSELLSPRLKSRPVAGAAASSGQTGWILFVLSYAVLANLPYWIAAHLLGLMPLGWLCAEYAVIGLLALWLPRAAAAVLLFFAITADLLSGVSKTYYLAPSECLANLAAVQEFTGIRLLGIALVAVLVALTVGVATMRPGRSIQGTARRRCMALLLGFLVLTLSIDFVQRVKQDGQWSSLYFKPPAIDGRSRTSLDVSWANRYPALRLWRGQRNLAGPSDASIFDLRQAPTVDSAARQGLPDTAMTMQSALHDQPNVVLVLTESWGLSRDGLIRDSLVHAYAQPQVLAQYTISQGTVPFFGATVAGEVRELCASRAGFQIMQVAAQAVRVCLPERLKAQGYRTIALHGMDGHMFHRVDWYERIGFEEKWFRSDLRRQGLPDCTGVFTGTCDAAIAAWIGERLARPDPQPSFIYWVTLNSHLPVPVPSPVPAAASCSLTPLLATDPALCSWYQLIANVLNSVARAAVSNLSRPTVFVVVGDHIPPFASPRLRSQFSEDEVPYVVLRPRPGSFPVQALPARQQVPLVAGISCCGAQRPLAH